MKLSDFRQLQDNPNQHTERGQYALETSIEELGYLDSMVSTADGTIISGNLRSEVAFEKLGDDVIVVESDGTKPIIHIRTDLQSSDPRAKLAAVAANRVAEVSLEWDADVLAKLQAEDVGLEKFFHEEELTALLGNGHEPPADVGPQFDRAAELQQEWGTELGQVWEIPSATVAGKCHRLVCGDCTDAEVVARVMGGEQVIGCFTSPPYAMQRKNQYGGIVENDYVNWWKNVQCNVKAILKNEGNFFVNIKPFSEGNRRSLYVFDLVCAMVRDWKWLFVDEYCWLRTGIPQQVVNRFKNAFEPIYWFAKSGKNIFFAENVRHESYNVPVPKGVGAGDTNTAKRQGTGKFAVYGNKVVPGLAYPSNVLDFRQNATALGHPAAYPEQLPSFFIQAYSESGNVWFDPFLGSGTTLVAAERLGRLCYGVEIAPKYVAVALQRVADMGLTPVLQSG